MPNYDFRVLSPIDFEMLVRDLLQKKLKVILESFSSGRDTGIDFRYTSLSRRKVIVQCKHYPDSTFSTMLSQLKNNELPKVQKLQPDRYILATSQPLTPLKKQKLLTLFSPFIVQPSDIYGKEDLNNLLGRFKSVERDHIKLWFSNSLAMERFLHTRRLNLSRETLIKIRRDARLYVKNESFSEAMTILETHNVCLIVGVPGIGKTMLAEMLLLGYHSKGFEIVKIESDIKEASDVDYRNKRRIFYYDDFLGQASIADKLKKNEDQSLLDFMMAIKNSRVSKLILTTREYILNQSKLVYEKIDRSKLDLNTCVIDLSRYTRLNRAKILYNHIYFSRLPVNYRKALLADKSYITIIDHPNYNPRIIESLTEVSRVSDLKPKEYVARFFSALDNPEDIWRHAFSSQLLPESKDLLLILVTLPREVFVADLVNAFKLFRNNNPRDRVHLDSEAFRRALKELDGNFIATERSSGELIVRFHNPSVRDFLQNHLAANSDALEAVVRSIASFDQVFWLWSHQHNGTNRYRFRSHIRKSLASEFLESVKLSRKLPVYRLESHYVRGKRLKSRASVSIADRISLIGSIAKYFKTTASRTILNTTLVELTKAIDAKLLTPEELVDLINTLKGSLGKTRWLKLLEATGTFLKNTLESLDDYRALVNFNQRYPEVLTSSAMQHVAMSFPDFARRFVGRIYIFNPDDLRTYMQEIGWIADALEVDADDSINDLEHAAREQEEIARKEEDERRREALGQKSRIEELKQTSENGNITDREIESMFSSLT